MKNIIPFHFFIIFLIILPVNLFSATGPRIIRLQSPESVEVSRNGELIADVERGMELQVGDFLKTGDNAKVFLSFPNGDSAVINEKTSITIEMFTFIEETETLRTRLRMDEGELIADLEKLKQNQYDPQFDVATKVGIAGIRGTQFLIRVRIDPRTDKIYANFGVTRGQVEVELTGLSATVARSLLNDVGAGDELIVTGDFDEDIGEVTQINSVDSVNITPETKARVEQAVVDFVQANEEFLKEAAEKEAAEKEAAEKEKAEREKAEKEKAEKEKAEREKAEREKAEKEKAKKLLDELNLMDDSDDPTDGAGKGE